MASNNKWIKGNLHVSDNIYEDGHSLSEAYAAKSHDHTSMVHKSGTETITGNKTFTGISKFNNNAEFNYVNIKSNWDSYGEINSKKAIWNNGIILDGTLDLHPEGNPVIFPYYMNDLAYLIKKGGSCAVKYRPENGTDWSTISSVNIESLFDGTSSYTGYTVNSLNDTVVIVIKAHKTFSFNTRVGISSGSAHWRAKNIQIDMGYMADTSNFDSIVDTLINAEADESGLTTTNVTTTKTWVTRARATDYAYGTYFSVANGPMINGAPSWNIIRITLTNFNNTRSEADIAAGKQNSNRFAGVFALNYGSEGLNTTLLGRKGGEMYGDIYPYVNEACNLGSSNYRWRDGYFKNVHHDSIEGNYVMPLTDNFGSVGSVNKKWNVIRGTNVYGDILYENNIALGNKYSPRQFIMLDRNSATVTTNCCSFFTITFDSTWKRSYFTLDVKDIESGHIDGRYLITFSVQDVTNKISCNIRQVYMEGKARIEVFAVQNENILTFYLKLITTSYCNLMLFMRDFNITGGNYDFKAGTWTTGIPEATFIESDVLDGAYIPIESPTMTKTKYRIALRGWDPDNINTIRYYKLCNLPINNDNNCASAIISGRIGGWSSTNMSYINALIWNRGTPGISLINIAGAATQTYSIWNLCDLVLYTNADNSATLYLKCTQYYTFDLDLEVFQDIANIVYDGTYITTTPTGTLAAQASTSTKRLELINGELQVNGESLMLSKNAVQKVSNTHNWAAQVYGIGNDGTQKMWNVATTAAGYTIPYRHQDGQLSVATPTANEHAATKEYVDTNYIPKKSVNNAYQAIVDNSGAAFTVTAGLSNNTGQTIFKIAPSGIATINDKQIVTKDDLSNASVAKIETSDTIFGANDEGYPTIVNKSGDRIIGIGSGDEGLLDNYMYYTFPEKQGTVALMTDIPTKSSWNYDDSYVKYSAAQTLTDAQKTQARSNIGAGTSSFTGYTSSNKLSTDYINNKEGWTSNTGTVIGSSLTDGYFVMGNGGVNIDISTMKPTTSSTTWSATSDVNVPTMKAISNYVTGLGYTKNAGTVTSVRVQATSPVVSSSNTAQTSSLNTTISLADGYGDTKNPYASKTKNWVLAAPNGSAGAPTFRALVAADIPSLPSNKITAMTGYSKASSALAIAATDSLNTAIGKLEKALDGKGTSNLTLGTTATTAAKGDHTHSVATTSANGLMSKEDKTKLDTISNNYVKEYSTGKNGMPGTIINNGSSIYIKSGNDSINVIGEGDEHGVGISVGDNNFVNFYQDRTEMIDAPVKIKQIQAPTASNGTTYGLGTSGQVLKSNGTSVYWANNTTYTTFTRGLTDFSPAYTLTAKDAGFIHTWWRCSSNLYASCNFGNVIAVSATNLFPMQKYSPSTNTSNQTTAYQKSVSSGSGSYSNNSSNAFQIPQRGDMVIDQYGCIGVIESDPTTVVSTYSVRLVWKSIKDWSCLEKGTQITLADGTYKNIEDVRQGESIMGWDFEKNEPCEAIALFADAAQADEKTTYLVLDNGEILSMTDGHTLYSKNLERYIPINDLREGDILMGKDGEDVEVVSIHWNVHTFGIRQFYHIVSSNNTYFANNTLNAIHPVDKYNWLQNRSSEVVPDEILAIFEQDKGEFDCFDFTIKNKEFLALTSKHQSTLKKHRNKIGDLKNYLTNTDYVAIKMFEGLEVDETILDIRKEKRKEINALEKEIEKIEKEYNNLLVQYSDLGEDMLLSDNARRSKYFKVACKNDNEHLDLFKKYYPLKDEAYILKEIEEGKANRPITEVIEEEESE